MTGVVWSYSTNGLASCHSDVANSDQKTADIKRPNIIHIAATKGKGGTCA